MGALLATAGCASLANKDDIYLLKSELNEDVASLQREVSLLKEQVQELTQTVDYVEKDTANQILSLSTEVSDKISVLESSAIQDKEAVNKKFDLILDEVAKAEQRRTPVSRTVRRTPPPGSKTYMVRTGDTITKIARRFDVPIEELMAANEIQDENYLAIGDILVIPSE